MKTEVKLLGIALISVAVNAMLSRPVFAIDHNWNATNGRWSVAANWHTITVPGSSDVVYLGVTNYPSPCTSTVDTAGSQCQKIIIGATPGYTGTLEITDGDFTIGSGGAVIGNSGCGTVIQTNGAWNSGGVNLNIGSDADAEGIYQLSGGIVSNYNWAFIGLSGNGTLELSNNGKVSGVQGGTSIGHSNGSTGLVTQTGGTWDNNTRPWYVGNNVGSYGTYQLSGGTLTNCEAIRIGYQGYGKVELSGGSISDASSQTYVGSESGSTGVVEPRGGTWDNANKTLYIGNLSGSDGTYQLSGGTLTNCLDIRIGHYGNGTFELNGSGEIQGCTTYIGQENGGVGQVTQTGGTWNNSSNSMYIGYNAGSEGTYQLSAGLLTNCAGFRIGRYGKGTFELSGSGHATKLRGLIVGRYSGSTGIVIQTGGSIDLDAEWPNIGQYSGSSGRYEISGGVFSNYSTCYLGNLGSGTLVISTNGLIGASPAWASMQIGFGSGGTGLIQQTGGTFNNPLNHQVFVARSGSGTYEISGGILTNLYDLRLGVGSGTGTFHIIGSDASIHIDGYSHENANSKLKVAPDSQGISAINVGGNIDLDGPLNVDFTGYIGKSADLVLIDYTGTRTGQFAATNILGSDWTADVEYDDIGKQVKLTNIDGPPTGSTLFFR